MRKKMGAVLLVVILLAVAAAGCGSGDKAKPAAEKQNPTIVIGYTPWTGYGALFVAKEKGMFQKQGVNVELQSIEGVGDRKQALVANKIQAMAASLDVSVSAAGEGVPMKFVWAFDASNGADGLIVKKDAGIQSVADLKGKEVAYHKGSASHFFLTVLLDKAGLSDRDIKAVDMKASEAASALMAGKVPAAVTWEPHLSKAAAAGDIVLATTKDTPDLIADVLAFRGEFVKDDPKTVQAVVNALAEATEFMQKNPEETSQILAAAFKEKPEEVKEEMKTIKYYDLAGNLEFYGTKDKPGPIFAVGQRAGQFYVDIKLLSQTPDLNQYIDNSFLTQVKK